MAVNSKRKGKTGELELARKLREYGYNARRTVQYCGKAEDGEADLQGLPGIHIECKRVEQLSLYKAIDQAKRDSAGSDKLPAVFHRKNNCEWLVAMPLDSFMKIYREYELNRESEGAESEQENADRENT
jgi:Holliday junction resolvase